MTVHEVSERTGVSVRALHHYDAIGLLKPEKITESGYRIYGAAELGKLREILLLKELGFSLKEIGRMLEKSEEERKAALRDHLVLLRMEREHIDGLIREAEKMMKGAEAGFAAFDRSVMENYRDEVKKKWGNTAAYREAEEKHAGKNASEEQMLADGLMEKFAGFGKLKKGSPASPEAQEMVRSLQVYITENYYHCTDEILSGLGEMYAGDERFRENIDRAGGDGTAVFVRDAIRTKMKH